MRLAAASTHYTHLSSGELSLCPLLDTLGLALWSGDHDFPRPSRPVSTIPESLEPKWLRMMMMMKKMMMMLTRIEPVFIIYLWHQRLG